MRPRSLLRLAFAAVLASLLAGAPATQAQPAPQRAAAAHRAMPAPVLLQGALRMETAWLISQLQGAHQEAEGPWTFWRGHVDGYPVVVSLTRMGSAQAAAATAVAIRRYRPIAIINQGTAGGHDPGLRVGDIVLGASAISIAAFKAPARAAGQGSNPLAWLPMDPVARPGDADDGELHEGQTTCIPADPRLLTIAQQAAASAGRTVVSGVIASSEVWNEELDRIAQLRATLGSSVEEMETAPAALVARLYGVPFLGVRVVTANATNGGAYDDKAAQACQAFALAVARRYVAALPQHRRGTNMQHTR